MRLARILFLAYLVMIVVMLLAALVIGMPGP
jgi:uncharacterized membrane protein YtjA (UPF0391 family)